jgi:hypothetical protein
LRADFNTFAAKITAQASNLKPSHACAYFENPSARVDRMKPAQKLDEGGKVTFSF